MGSSGGGAIPISSPVIIADAASKVASIIFEQNPVVRDMISRASIVSFDWLVRCLYSEALRDYIEKGTPLNTWQTALQSLSVSLPMILLLCVLVPLSIYVISRISNAITWAIRDALVAIQRPTGRPAGMKKKLG